MQLAAAARATRLFRTQERGVARCEHAKCVARRARTARSSMLAARAHALKQRMERAERRRVAFLGDRTHSAHVANMRVADVMERSRQTASAVSSASSDSDFGMCGTADTTAAAAAAARHEPEETDGIQVVVMESSPRRHHTSQQSTSSTSSTSTSTSASMDSTGTGSGMGAATDDGAPRSPPRQRRRLMGAGNPAGGASTTTTTLRWFDAAASPRRRPCRAHNPRTRRAARRRAQQRQYSARRRREALAQARLDGRKRARAVACERVARVQACQADRLRQTRSRLFEQLRRATRRRAGTQQRIVSRARAHVARVQQRAARVRHARSVLRRWVVAHLLRRRRDYHHHHHHHNPRHVARHAASPSHRRADASPSASSSGTAPPPPPAAAAPSTSSTPIHAPAAAAAAATAAASDASHKVHDEGADSPRPQRAGTPDRGQGDQHRVQTATTATAAVRRVRELVQGKTMRSMLATLRAVLQRSSPSEPAATRYTFPRCSRTFQQKKVVLAFRGVVALVVQATEGVLGFTGAHAASRRAPRDRSARTLMASVMIAHYPGDMFDAAALKDPQSRERRLVHAAQAVVGCLRVLGCGAGAGAGAAGAGAAGVGASTPREGLPSASRTEGGDEAADTAAAAAAAATEAAAPASAPTSAPTSASTPASPTTTTTTTPQAVVGTVTAFHAAWLAYMDAFSDWKAHDGATLAAQMVPGFIQLELTRRMYARQYDELRRDTDLAAAAATAESPAPAHPQVLATQQLLAGVGAHMTTMRRQVVNLLGQQGARAWERATLARLERELGDGDLPPPPAVTLRATGAGAGAGAATDAHMRKESTGSTGSAGSGGSSGSRSATRVAPSSTMRHVDPASTPTRVLRTPTRRHGSGRMARKLMSNAALVHKLVLDPAFRLPVVDQPRCIDRVVQGEPAAAAVGPTAAVDADAAPSCTCPAGSPWCAQGWLRQYRAAAAAASHDAMADAVVAELRTVRSKLIKLTPNRQVRRHHTCGCHGAYCCCAAWVGNGMTPDCAWLAQLTRSCFFVSSIVAVVIVVVVVVAVVVVVVVGGGVQDLITELKQAVDLSFIANNFRAGAFDARSFAALVGFLGDKLAHLEAPAHEASTRAWVRQFQAAVEAVAAAGSALPPLRLLAAVTAWLHFKLAQIHVDISNFQLSTLSPYLAAGGRGSDYERKKFDEARAQGRVTLAGTALWLRDSLAAALTVAAPAGATTTATAAATATATATAAAPPPTTTTTTTTMATRDGLLRELQAGSAAVATDVVVNGTVGLLARPQSLLSLARAPAQESKVPETLHADVQDLTHMQNVLQRLALGAALLATVRQVLHSTATATTAAAATHTAATAKTTSESRPASCASASASASAGAGAGAAPLTLAQFATDLDAWLRADDMVLADLQEGVVSATIAIARHRHQCHHQCRQGRQGHQGCQCQLHAALSTNQVDTLRTAVAHSVDVKHPVFAIFLRRCVRALRHLLRAELALPAEAGAAAHLATARRSLGATPMVELQDTARRLGRIVRHNLAVHRPHYDALLRAIAAHMKEAEGSKQ